MKNKTALEIIVKKIIKETALITAKKILILLEITQEAIQTVILTVVEMVVNNDSQKNAMINWHFLFSWMIFFIITL